MWPHYMNTGSYNGSQELLHSKHIGPSSMPNTAYK